MLISQQPGRGLIYHSKPSTLYISDRFAKAIQKYKTTHSFSHKNSSYDNASIESFHAILKKEDVNHAQYINDNSTGLEIFQFIGSCYNRKVPVFRL